MSVYWHLWAKTNVGESNSWHALPCHLLDVAATAEGLWDRLPSRSRAPAERSLRDSAMARNLVIFLAAAHDIGKANRYFQAKDRRQAERLKVLGIEISSLDEGQRHGQATGAYLKPWLKSRWRWGSVAAETVALAVGGHHGCFYCDTKLSTLRIDDDPWREMGPALLDALADTLKVGMPPEPSPLNPLLGWLAGFVSVADWLGSHEQMTVWETRRREMGEYTEEARQRADSLLAHLNWQTPPCDSSLPLQDMVPSGRVPNALQQLAATVAPFSSLAIVEAPTGEGKTEAAFALAEPNRAAGAGIYFALPTMATANGLYGRVVSYLRKATGNDDLESRLLHSQAWLFRENARTAEDPGREGADQGSQAQDWFAGPKRGLLAPFGVGTIDQALIASLRARHGFVRLFALAGKTIVIDEVHAYDVYMGDLLAVLLGWLRALGCRVVLLSATLPKARREALLFAWGAQGELPNGDYPCVTWVTEGGEPHSSGFVVQPRKPLSFRLTPATEDAPWLQGAARILRHVRESGGLGGLILNTVRDAQNAYDWLRKQELDGILALFHARFTAQDRDAIERYTLDRYGKDRHSNQPAILVATQVIEQSLDLDFDHMVSALAPFDLLIQRAGRLHRHRRYADGRLREDDGPDERPNPVLEVLAPQMDDQGSVNDSVYSPYVLMRTLDRLKSGFEILHPCDIAQAIEGVYSEREREAALSDWERRLDEFEKETAKETAKRKRQAERVTIGRVEDAERLIVEYGLDLDENDERQGSQLAARTRLEDRPSITVLLLQEESGAPHTFHGADPANPRNAMFACVRISPPYPIWKALCAIEPLAVYRGKGALSQARPLFLTEGQMRMGDYLISYDSDRGLDWRKCDANL